MKKIEHLLKRLLYEISGVEKGKYKATYVRTQRVPPDGYINYYDVKDLTTGKIHKVEVHHYQDPRNPDYHDITVYWDGIPDYMNSYKNKVQKLMIEDELREKYPELDDVEAFDF